jgi:lysophospholipase L1-like esterase
MRAAAWAIGVTGAAGGVAAWVRYLARRQHHWRGLLSDAIPVNSSFWREQAARPPRERELLYVAIGDSAAQGIGASRPSHSYVGFIARHVRESTGRPVHVVNLAISGARVREALDRELPAFEKRVGGPDARLPDLVTVCIGANDIADFDAARFDAEIRSLLTSVARLAPQAIVADLPSFYFLPGEKKVRVANGLLRAAAADAGLEVVPLHDLTDRQGLWGVTTQFAGDLFHPNDRGYRIWADAFRPAVDRRLAS